jgi:hypothetical protein
MEVISMTFSVTYWLNTEKRCQSTRSGTASRRRRAVWDIRTSARLYNSLAEVLVKSLVQVQKAWMSVNKRNFDFNGIRTYGVDEIWHQSDKSDKRYKLGRASKEILLCLPSLRQQTQQLPRLANKSFQIIANWIRKLTWIWIRFRKIFSPYWFISVDCQCQPKDDHDINHYRCIICWPVFNPMITEARICLVISFIFRGGFTSKSI